MMPNCPKCKAELFRTDVGWENEKPALACTNPKCDFLISDTLGDFLYDDC